MDRPQTVPHCMIIGYCFCKVDAQRLAQTQLGGSGPASQHARQLSARGISILDLTPSSYASRAKPIHEHHSLTLSYFHLYHQLPLTHLRSTLALSFSNPRPYPQSNTLSPPIRQLQLHSHKHVRKDLHPLRRLRDRCARRCRHSPGMPHRRHQVRCAPPGAECSRSHADSQTASALSPPTSRRSAPTPPRR